MCAYRDVSIARADRAEAASVGSRWRRRWLRSAARQTPGCENHNCANYSEGLDNSDDDDDDDDSDDYVDNASDYHVGEPAIHSGAGGRGRA